MSLMHADWHGPVSLLGALLLFLAFRFVRWYFSSLRKLPGPQNRGSILGNLLEVMREPNSEPIKRWWKEAGVDARAIHFTLPLWSPCVLILDKEIVRTIVTAPYGKDNKLRFYRQTRILNDMIGEGLVALNGSSWMRHRRIIQPAFQTSFLRECLNESVPHKVNLLIKIWERVGPEREIDLDSHLSMLTLDVIGDVAFSHDFSALEALEEWSMKQPIADGNNDRVGSIRDPFGGQITHLTNANKITVLLFATGLIFFDRYVNPGLMRKRRLMDEAVARVVSNARTSCTRAKSLLHLLLQAKDPEGNANSSERVLSDAELRDEVKTFVVAGHETTSTWLYWALINLAKYPDVQDRVLDDILKHAPLSVKEITLEHVEKMEYMNAFLQEVLRVNPPIPRLPRFNNYVENFDGIVVPPHTRLVIPILLLHHHPKYWDNPADFSPERWINVSEEEAERRRFAFLPFSAGNRNCIGQIFATMEAQLILAPLLRSFRVVAAPSQRNTKFTFSPSSSITLKSIPRFKICVKKRQIENS